LHYDRADQGSLFAQEKVLISHLQLATALKLPIVLHLEESNEITAVKIKELGESAPSKIAIYNFIGNEDDLKSFLSLTSTVYFIITAKFITFATEKLEECKLVLPKIPLDRLLIATDSPYSTPQNIEDSWMREQKNEPSNIGYILRALAKILAIPEKDLMLFVYNNSKQFFGLLTEHEYKKFKEDQDAFIEAERLKKIIEKKKEQKKFLKQLHEQEESSPEECEKDIDIDEEQEKTTETPESTEKLLEETETLEQEVIEKRNQYIY